MPTFWQAFPSFNIMTSCVSQQDRQDRPKVVPGGPGVNRPLSDDIVVWVENHLEAWRQIPLYIGRARGKKIDSADEDQFLELKGVIVQELEMIMASGECTWPTKDEVHEMINNIPSLHYISQLNEGALGNVEHQWHLIYIRWHATLGQLKIKHRDPDSGQAKSGLLGKWW